MAICIKCKHYKSVPLNPAECMANVCGVDPVYGTVFYDECRICNRGCGCQKFEPKPIPWWKWWVR